MVSQLQVLAVLLIGGILFVLVTRMDFERDYQQCIQDGCSARCAEVQEYNPDFDCANEYYDKSMTDTTWVGYCCMEMTAMKRSGG